MMAGALGYRVPATGWKPEGWTPPAGQGGNAMITTRHVHVDQAWKTPQFWLLWGVLCLNVSAGIGVIGMASPLLQEVFAGQLIGVKAAYETLSADQLGRIAIIGGGFAGLISLFNIGGRFVWASFSDYLGRKVTYFVFFTLGILLYALMPSLGRTGQPRSCSWQPPASSCRCMGADSPRFRPILAVICSAPRWSARSTAAC